MCSSVTLFTLLAAIAAVTTLTSVGDSRTVTGGDAETKFDTLRLHSSKLSGNYDYHLSPLSLVPSEGSSKIRRRGISDTTSEESRGWYLPWEEELVPGKSAGGTKSDNRPLSPSKSSGSSTPEGPPHVGKLVLEWTGKTLQKQQRAAYAASKPPRTWDRANRLTNRIANLKYENTPVPKGLQEKCDRAQQRHTDTCIRYWMARDRVKQKGRDIESIGMVNKYFQKSMQRNFPALKTRWGLDEKKRRLETIDSEKKQAEYRKHQAKFLERMKRKRERYPEQKEEGSPKRKETPKQKQLRLKKQGPTKREARKKRDEKSGQLKEHDRERFRGLNTLFRQGSRDSRDSPSSRSRSKRSSFKESRSSSSTVGGLIRSKSDSASSKSATSAKKDGQDSVGHREQATKLLKKTGAHLNNAFRSCIGRGCPGGKTPF